MQEILHTEKKYKSVELNDLWEIISVFLLATLKFVFGAVPLALGFGFPFLKAVTVTSLGGFTGATVLVYLSDRFLAYFKRRKAQKKIDNPNAPAKQIFTKRNRLIVKVKKKFGLAGIAFISPSLIPIPIGCFIAVRYFKNKHKILVYMYCSILFWACTSYYFYKPIFHALHSIRTYFF